MLLGGALLAGAGAAGLTLRGLWRRERLAPGRYGPLRRDPAGVLDLPAAFAYTILSRRDDPMSDGHKTPWLPDAMACFAAPAGDAWWLVRNHEVSTDAALGPWRGAPAREGYDPRGMGGVTRLVLDPATLAVRSSNLVLAGTQRNCAGGPTPWRQWISCEETVVPGHGFAFLCEAAADRLQPARRLDALGRFNHEAAAIDPGRGIIYLTEDRTDGAFYRAVPADPARPFDGGRLEALTIRGRPRFDLATGLRPGARLEVAWVPVADPTPSDDTVRAQAHAAGAARVKRGEGLWWHEGTAVFTSTTGGPLGGGQVFRLRPDGDGGELELLAQAEDDRDLLDMPDNLTVAPWGEIVLCEDGPDGNHLRVLGADGQVWDLARNARSRGELAGACFAPDGGTLFVNLQQDGLTIAVRGPFHSPAEAPEPG
jgi:hypothetical protein